MTRMPYDEAPPAAVPYSTDARVDAIIAVAGQCGYLPDRTLAEGITEQRDDAAEPDDGPMRHGADEPDLITTGDCGPEFCSRSTPQPWRSRKVSRP